VGKRIIEVLNFGEGAGQLTALAGPAECDAIEVVLVVGLSAGARDVGDFGASELLRGAAPGPPGAGVVDALRTEGDGQHDG
jgi:hypothetical protein